MEEGPHGHHPVPHTAPYLQGELRQLPTLAKVVAVAFALYDSSSLSLSQTQGSVLLQELLAGGVAGGLSKTSVAPLERIKILFQVCIHTEHAIIFSRSPFGQASWLPADRAAARVRCWGDFAENTSHRGRNCPVQVTLQSVLSPKGLRPCWCYLLLFAGAMVQAF